MMIVLHLGKVLGVMVPVHVVAMSCSVFEVGICRGVRQEVF